MSDSHATYVFELLLQKREVERSEQLNLTADLAGIKARNKVLESQREELDSFRHSGHKDPKYVTARLHRATLLLDKTEAAVTWYVKNFMEKATNDI